MNVSASSYFRRKQCNFTWTKLQDTGIGLLQRIELHLLTNSLIIPREFVNLRLKINKTKSIHATNRQVRKKKN